MIDKFNRDLGQPGTKAYSSEDVQEFLLRNVDGYWDLPDEKKWKIEEQISKRLDKKGYKWIY